MKFKFHKKNCEMFERKERKEFKCVVTEKICWREAVKDEPRMLSLRGEGGYVKVECKDCKKVHDIWITN